MNVQVTGVRALAVGDLCVRQTNTCTPYIQIAEHDGSFSTYLLMVAVEQWAKQFFTPPDNESCSKDSTPYFAGAVESGLMESIGYVRHYQEGRTKEAQDKWDESARDNYRRWRDGFGAADMSDVWGPQGNFGGDLQVESLAKNILRCTCVCVSVSASVSVPVFHLVN